jgi:hypothetical protein
MDHKYEEEEVQNRLKRKLALVLSQEEQEELRKMNEKSPEKEAQKHEKERDILEIGVQQLDQILPQLESKVQESRKEYERLKELQKKILVLDMEEEYKAPLTEKFITSCETWKKNVDSLSLLVEANVNEVEFPRLQVGMTVLAPWRSSTYAGTILSLKPHIRVKFVDGIETTVTVSNIVGVVSKKYTWTCESSVPVKILV